MTKFENTFLIKQNKTKKEENSSIYIDEVESIEISSRNFKQEEDKIQLSQRYVIDKS